MNVIRDIPSGKDVPKNVNVFVEIPSGSKNKYEYDKDYEVVRLDRALFSPVHYPGNYGFVPQTLWYDGDALDILVITKNPVHPGVLIEARPIGAIEIKDRDEDDLKIIAVNSSSPNFDKIQEIDDLSESRIEEIKHFFKVYKELEKVDVKVNRTLSREEAEKAILRAIEMYNEKN